MVEFDRVTLSYGFPYCSAKSASVWLRCGNLAREQIMGILGPRWRALTVTSVLAVLLLALAGLAAPSTNAANAAGVAQPLDRVPVPVVKKLSRSTVAVAGGEWLTIRGSGLGKVRRVLFGDTRAKSFRVVSARVVKVVVPRRPAGVVSVRVVTPAGKSRASRASRLRFVDPVVPLSPVVESMMPRSGPTAGGTVMTLTGRGLAGADAASFGPTVTTSVRSLSATTVRIVVPAGSAGTVQVFVRVAKRVVDAGTFSYIPPGPDPAAVYDLRARSQEPRSVSLYWRAAVSEVDRIEVRRLLGPVPPTATTGKLVATLGPRVSGYRDAGLVDGATYSYAVVAMRGGSAVAAATVTSALEETWPVPGGWTAPAVVHFAEFLGPFECPVDGYCVSVGGLNGGYATFADDTWSRPRPLDDIATRSTALSCVGPSFCLALDPTISSREFDGSTWADPVPVTHWPYPDERGYPDDRWLDCATTTFCMLMDRDANTWVYDGAMWSESGTLPEWARPGLEGVASLSCPSARFCVALGMNGESYTFDGEAWTRTNDGPVSHDGLGCMSATFCVAVRDLGSLQTFNGQAWSQAAPISDLVNDDPVQVECFAAACLVKSGSSLTYVYVAGAWYQYSPPKPLGYLACASVTFCLAPLGYSSSSGQVFNPTGGAIREVPARRNQGGFLGIDCVSSSSCHATANLGQTLELDSDGWSEPISNPLANQWPHTMGLNLARPAHQLSCPGDNFCMSVGSTPQRINFDDVPHSAGFATFDGQRWTDPAPAFAEHLASGLTAVSCTSATFCLASLDRTPSVAMWDGTTWSDPEPVDVEGSVYVNEVGDLSCVIENFCAAISNQNVMVYRGAVAGWSDPVRLAEPFETLASVSCTSPQFCMALSDEGQAWAFDGTTWSSLGTATDAFLINKGSIDCGSPELCVAVTGGTNAFVYDGETWTRSVAVTTNSSLTGVSCVSNEVCVAVDNRGNVMEYRP